eukprot:m.34661 g.34661  ORF g.34661 m.34661 type:complete len:164 (+) comp14322_c0_seq4:1124-1615(+)
MSQRTAVCQNALLARLRFCVYVYVCAHVRVYICLCFCVSMCVSMCACVCACTNLLARACLRAVVQACWVFTSGSSVTPGDSANGQPAIAAIQAAHIHAVFQYDFHRDRDVVKVHPGPLQAYGSNHIVEHLKECTNVDVFIGCCFCALCQPPVYSYNLDYSQRE